jgi:RNA ligase (TIGR02306 family)
MTEVYVRKMASIQKIAEVKAIPDADKICAYRVNGWWIVDQVGKYVVGDLVVYAEPDSFIPSTLAPFLTKSGHFPKIYLGVEGEKLRTIRLRKQLSQGLLLPLDSVLTAYNESIHSYDETEYPMEGTDVSEMLGIVKWEAPPEFTSADARGSFPSFIIKTDQERVQNCFHDMAEHFPHQTWEVTEKAEGSSMTVYHRDGDFGVCSRNLDLKESEVNTFWKMVLELDLKRTMMTLGENIAIQGELCGPGIQGNIYNLSKHMFFVFDIFDIDKFEYYSPTLRRQATNSLGLTDVPVLEREAVLTGHTCDSLLAKADGGSVLGMMGCLREGLVFKANSDRRISFKAVSNKYLEKQG